MGVLNQNLGQVWDKTLMSDIMKWCFIGARRENI